ncbi:MAG: aldehyde dehydrogenase family protein, partial [Planctomycetes bacterium]|nr:aldehyde dehydrogenase family protein [Planctomycetota bacterium]
VKTQLEMGGKNALVVLADADLDLAADAAVGAAYACAGQWCTSTSRVIVAAPVAEAFERKLVERVAAIRVGDGQRPDTGMGPVCGTAQRDGILAAIAAATAAGARLAFGGRRLTADGMERGCFIEPTVFADVAPTSALARDEIFGPVLALIRVADFAEAVAVSNDVEFGLCSSIYTASLAHALQFVERSEVGVAHVNLPTSLKEPQLPFGGIKRSGFGTPEAGHAGVEFFTRHQAVYVRFAAG